MLSKIHFTSQTWIEPKVKISDRLATHVLKLYKTKPLPYPIII